MRRSRWLLGVVVLSLTGCGGHSNGNRGDDSEPGTTAGGASGSSSGQAPDAGTSGGGMAGQGTSEAGGSGGIPIGGEAGTANAGGSTNGGASGCSVADFEGLNVFSAGSWDPLGYPPYALDGCQLAYVAPEAGGGALYLRDLVSGTQVLLEPAESRPRRPALAGDLVAWEVEVDGKSQVRVRFQGELRQLLGSFDHTGEPRAARDALVFTAFMGTDAQADSDVYIYEPMTDSSRVVAGASGQQRFADVSSDYVAITDFSEDPRGYFNEVDSVANVVLFERATGAITVRERDGKQAFPLLGSDGALVYLDWGAVHPEPKFSQFSLRAGSVTRAVEADVDLKGAPIQTSPAYVRPSLRGKVVDFIDTEGEVGLYRVTLDGAASPVRVPIAGSSQLFGPVAGDAFTLVARPLVGQTLALTAVAR